MKEVKYTFIIRNICFCSPISSTYIHLLSTMTYTLLTVRRGFKVPHWEITTIQLGRVALLLCNKLVHRLIQETARGARSYTINPLIGEGWNFSTHLFT